jgi:hypothetical protein
MSPVTPAPATRARGSSGTATYPVAKAPVSWHRTALGPPRAPWREMWAIKVNKYLLEARPSWSLSG